MPTPPYTLEQRAACYAHAFPHYRASWPVVWDRWLSATWMLGNNYKGSGYYGAYPPGYLPRLMALFPDCGTVLHLFSGSLPKGPYTRLDSNPANQPEVVADAHTMDTILPLNYFDLLCADPPYSKEDAVHYGTPMVNRRLVLQQAHRVLKPGGFLAWMDTILPMYRKAQWQHWGNLTLIRSTNHRVRLVSLFTKV